jgi:Domain of unknown function (DUF1707)
MTDRLRVSDAEREEAVTALRAAAGDGRLTVEELGERTAAAYAAVTRGELARLLDDLPGAPAPEGRALRRRGPRLPGRAGFAARWSTRESREAVALDILHDIAPPLHAYGYQLADRTPDRIVFARPRRPAWTIVVAIAFFPVGLLALLYTASDRITIDFARRKGETICVAQGVAPLSIRRAFAQLEE